LWHKNKIYANDRRTYSKRRTKVMWKPKAEHLLLWSHKNKIYYANDRRKYSKRRTKVIRKPKAEHGFKNKFSSICF